jgi:hypothetical protein
MRDTMFVRVPSNRILIASEVQPDAKERYIDRKGSSFGYSLYSYYIFHHRHNLITLTPTSSRKQRQGDSKRMYAAVISDAGDARLIEQYGAAHQAQHLPR